MAPTGDLPLAGYVVGITADRRADEQAHLLSRLGAEIIAGPALSMECLDPLDEIYPATQQVIAQPPDVLVITTGIGFLWWIEATASIGALGALRRALADTRIVARGAKAAGALVAEGFDVAWTAGSAGSEEILARLASEEIGGEHMAVQLDGSSSNGLVSGLWELGAARVTEVPVYRIGPPTNAEPINRLVSSVVDSRVDAVTFTSRRALNGFLDAAEHLEVAHEVIARLNSSVAPVFIGPICAVAATEAGIRAPATPACARLGAMVQLVVGHFADRRLAFLAGGHEIVIQGRMVTVDAEVPIVLTHRESGVLAALAERPGAVVSKEYLLRTLWERGEADGHVVEVVIARLRQRLHQVPDAIQTVVRRGYRLDT